MKSSKDHGNAEEVTNGVVNEDENKYLDQIRYILKNGERISDRTGVGTISVFGMHSIYSLRNGVDADYTNQGIDQLSQIIDLIKNEPHSRRIILNAWNVAELMFMAAPVLDLKLMALPPCHTLAQFAVRNGELSCQLYQRSGDMGLGVPFNLASYGLLTHMIAHVCGLKAGHLCHVLGDAHIYVNHVDALQEQLKRQPRSFPTVRFVGNIKTIDDFTYESIILENYQPMPTIKMAMAV
uniref:Thymidylate synthase n=1 Tax=Elaeophora elaphi TaxID=1147741 RepID=A0A0R3S1W5_9BILA